MSKHAVSNGEGCMCILQKKPRYTSDFMQTSPEPSAHTISIHPVLDAPPPPLPPPNHGINVDFPSRITAGNKHPTAKIMANRVYPSTG